MTAKYEPLTMEQGATFEHVFSWHYDDPDNPGAPGDPIDLTNATARMQVRKSQQAPVLVEALSDGATPHLFIDGPTGTVTIKLPASETSKLSVKEPLYDLEVELPGGDVHRLIEGPVTVIPNITQVAGEPRVK